MKSASEIITFNVGAGALSLEQFYALPDGHQHAKTSAELPLLCFCIKHEGHLVMVDAAALPHNPIDWPGFENREQPAALPEQLVAQQIDARAVTELIISHAHWDHYNGLCHIIEGETVPLFPRARHIINKADWHPDNFAALEKRSFGVVDRAGLVDLVEGRVEICQGLTIIPAPGETPGHQIVELKADGQYHYFCGDLFHNPIEFDDLAINVRWANVDTMQESKIAILTRAARNGGILYFSHIEGRFRVEQVAERFLITKF